MENMFIKTNTKFFKENVPDNIQINHFPHSWENFWIILRKDGCQEVTIQLKFL
jgi:hypothetical protein